MKKSDLEQIIKEEITTVITENFLKNLVQAGIKLFSKIRGGAVITSAQRTGLVKSLSKDAVKAKKSDIRPLLDDLKSIRVELVNKDKLITSEKLMRSLDLKNFPGFKSELGRKGFSMSYLEIDAMRKILKIAMASGRAVPAGAAGALLTAFDIDPEEDPKFDTQFPPKVEI